MITKIIIVQNRCPLLFLCTNSHIIICTCISIQMVTKGILKYCLRGLLGDTQRETLFLFLDALTDLLAPEIPSEHLGQIEQQVHLALARLERDFPVSVQVCSWYISCGCHGKTNCTFVCKYQNGDHSCTDSCKLNADVSVKATK